MLWHVASTAAYDRQAIAPLILWRVVIGVFGASERAELSCHWASGPIARHELIGPVRLFEQLEHWDRVIVCISAFREADATAQVIAGCLNAQG